MLSLRPRGKIRLVELTTIFIIDKSKIEVELYPII